MSPDPETQDAATTRQNFWIMVAYQILLRIGWIFKTESVIMPSFLDFLGGSDWVRGVLPIFNRFGQAVPPLVASDWVANQKQKKWALVLTTLAMAVCFLIIAVGYLMIKYTRTDASVFPIWAPWAFIAVYAAFFSSFGINQLVQNTIQGKVIQVRQRGQLMTWSSLLGVTFAVTSAWLLLPYWLSPHIAAFQWVFAITGLSFLIAGCAAMGFRERDDPPHEVRNNTVETLRLSMAVFVSDANFRRYALVACAFGMNMVLFPHYQALAKATQQTDLNWLMPWLVAQNLGAALFSTVAGRIADRIGNVLAIRILMGIQIATPILALISSYLGPEMKWTTIVVFFVLGATPVTYRVLSNFTLELVPRPLHPRYLSSLAVCLALPPILLGIPTGLLIGQIGFSSVFLGVACIFAVGLGLMFTVEDPRTRQS